MEEQILKIIKTERNFSTMAGKIDTMTHEHYMKFIKWKEKKCRYDIVRKDYLIIGIREIREPKTLEEIYQFWLTNVEHK
jgi:hypothetical protein